MKTRHSQIRQQQRGVSDLMRDLILQFGKPIQARGDAVMMELPRGFLQIVERAMQCRFILCGEVEVTVERKIKRSKKRCKDHNGLCPTQPKNRN